MLITLTHQKTNPDLTGGAIVALMVVIEVFRERGVKIFRLAHARDGQHMPTSLHFSGNAFDIEYPKNWTDEEKATTCKVIKSCLNENYDVINHGSHMHVEYQPRGNNIYK